MKTDSSYKKIKITFIVVVLVAAIVLGGGSARAAPYLPFPVPTAIYRDGTEEHHV